MAMKIMEIKDNFEILEEMGFVFAFVDPYIFFNMPECLLN